MAVGRILFLDLARVTGWAEGVPGESFASGSIQLAPSGAGQGAVAAGLMQFLRDRFEQRRYHEVSFEAPLDTRHMKKTNFATARQLAGVCFIAEGMAYEAMITRVTECRVQYIRKHLLGRQPKAGMAKVEITDRVKMLGHKPRDDNEADAIAGWLYVAAIRAPGKLFDTPLFTRGQQQ